MCLPLKHYRISQKINIDFKDYAQYHLTWEHIGIEKVRF